MKIKAIKRYGERDWEGTDYIELSDLRVNTQFIVNGEADFNDSVEFHSPVVFNNNGKSIYLYSYKKDGENSASLNIGTDLRTTQFTGGNIFAVCSDGIECFRIKKDKGLTEIGNLQINNVETAKVKSNHTGSEAESLMGYMLDKVYPVGSIYISTSSTSPASLFGGTWERIKHCFLLGAGDGSDFAGSTGGSFEASLPRHTHGTLDLKNFEGFERYTSAGHMLNFATKDIQSDSGGYCLSLETLKNKGILEYGHDRSKTVNGGYAYINQTTAAGDEESSKRGNLPPYLAVYMWRRKS